MSGQPPGGQSAAAAGQSPSMSFKAASMGPDGQLQHTLGQDPQLGAGPPTQFGPRSMSQRVSEMTGMSPDEIGKVMQAGAARSPPQGSMPTQDPALLASQSALQDVIARGSAKKEAIIRMLAGGG